MESGFPDLNQQIAPASGPERILDPISAIFGYRLGGSILGILLGVLLIALGGTLLSRELVFDHSLNICPYITDYTRVFRNIMGNFKCSESV